MNGNPRDVLAELASGQNGIVTPRDALSVGIDPVRLRQMAQRGTFRHVSRGVYRLTAYSPTKMTAYMQAAMWPGSADGVLSHETALDLHDLCDVNPDRIDVTVPLRFRRSTRTPPRRYALHYRDLAVAGITYLEGVPIVTPVRAILDGIEVGTRRDLLVQAIESLRGRGGLGHDDEMKLFASLAAREMHE